jgi:hypothetical protein
MAAQCFPIFFGYTSLYAFLVTIACSQLEKLKACLLNISQKQDTAERDSGADTDQEEEGQVHSCLQPFRHMQEQLNDCIRHHQQILRYAKSDTPVDGKSSCAFKIRFQQLHDSQTSQTQSNPQRDMLYTSFAVKTEQSKLPHYVERLNTMFDTVLFGKYRNSLPPMEHKLRFRNGACVIYFQRCFRQRYSQISRWPS